MKKALTFSILAVVLLSVGIGAILYANSQKTTFSPTTLSPEKERVFEFIPNDARYDPEQHKCYAYAYLAIRNHNWGGSENELEEFYVVTTSYDDTPTFPQDEAYHYFLIETMEGELTDCVECQYRCSAYYALCDKYNVTPEDRPTP